MGTPRPGSGDHFVAPGGPHGLSGGGPPAQALKILVIDDEPALARVAGRLLKREFGLTDDHLLTSFDADAALAVFDQNAHAIGAVLSDMMMPHGSGLDVYHHARKSRPNLPIAFWSGFMPPDFREELDAILQRDPQTAFFRKPISNTPFLAWFRSALLAAGTIA